jgi:phosphate transport system substrate-binding protein
MKGKPALLALPAVVLAVWPTAMVRGDVKVDPELPEYKAVSGVSGTIKSVGSDTMINLVTLWGEGFKKFYPSVQIEIEGKGSATAPTALIKGTANFGPMSREMKQKEIDDFEKVFKYKPTALQTSIDMLAVYVHKDNPIKGLTLQQIDAIFSKNRNGGYGKDIDKWGDLGLQGEWADKPISLYGRNSASGTYGYFKEHALFNGDFKNTVKEQAGSSAVVQGVATDKYGIGYSGIGYITPNVRAVPLAKNAKSKAIGADAKNLEEYPMARYLYVYVNFAGDRDLDPLRREFIKFIFSRDGQLVVVKDGYLPVGAEIAKQALKSVKSLASE